LQSSLDNKGEKAKLIDEEMKSEEESESEADGIDFINPQFNGTKNSIDLYGKIKKFKGILK